MSRSLGNHWYSFDPGERTGFAKFDGLSETPLEIGEILYDDFFSWMTVHIERAELPRRVVVEDFKIRPTTLGGKHYNHDWNDGKTLQLIGALKYVCWSFDIPVVLQQPSVKPVAYKMAGMKYVKGRAGMHMQDAIVHGVYYLRRRHNRELAGTLRPAD